MEVMTSRAGRQLVVLLCSLRITGAAAPEGESFIFLLFCFLSLLMNFLFSSSVTSLIKCWDFVGDSCLRLQSGPTIAEVEFVLPLAELRALLHGNGDCGNIAVTAGTPR